MSFILSLYLNLPFREQPSGLAHVTPCAVAFFSYFSEKGNLGKKIQTKKITLEIKDLKNASQEVGYLHFEILTPRQLSLSCLPLSCQHDKNDVMEDYFVWIQKIQSKVAMFCHTF